MRIKFIGGKNHGKIKSFPQKRLKNYSRVTICCGGGIQEYVILPKRRKRIKQAEYSRDFVTRCLILKEVLSDMKKATRPLEAFSNKFL